MQLELMPEKPTIPDNASWFSPNGMDSREIANLTEKRHADVCRDILNILEQLGEPERRFASGYFDAQGQQRKCFLLPKRECLILASGYNVVLRAKIIDRWAELEARTTPPKDLTRLEILRMAIQAEERVEALEAQRLIDAPKVAALALFEGASGLFGVREASKQASMGQKAFVAFLVSEKIMYRLSGDLIPFQPWINAGYFALTTGTTMYGDDVHSWRQTKFTAKGIAWIAVRVAALLKPESKEKIKRIATPKKPRKSRAKKKVEDGQ